MTNPHSALVATVLAALGIGLGGALSPQSAQALSLGQFYREQPQRISIGAGLGPLATEIAQLSAVVLPLQATPTEPAAGSTPPTSAQILPGLPSRSPLSLPRPRPGGVDPADQVAPAIIDLDAQNRPINPVLSMTMREELNNLIGRFESALLTANSSQQPTKVSLDQAAPVLTASANTSPIESDGTVLHPALLEARQLLNEWNDLIAQGKYAIARQRWQAVRQSLWDNLPTDRPSAQTEIRAIWLDRGTLVQARSPEGLAQVFDRMATAGVNTVFVETVNAGYPIYPSSVAPNRNPLISSWDPLKAAVDLGHERGMSVHAWIWTFAVGNQVHNRLLNLPLDYPGPLLTLHPDWAGYDNLGNVVPPGQTKPFLDPANPEVRSYLMRLISEIITNYEVDGLQLDYIRYPFQDPGAGRSYGYGTAARWRFRAMTGIDPLQLATGPGQNATEAERRFHRQMWDRWTDFRVQQISSFVQEVSLMARRQRPDLILSTAVFARPELERRHKIQQDWGTWASQGYVDWIVLMSYAEDTNRFAQLVEPWLVSQTFGRALVIPGIRLLNLPQPAALDQILATRDLPASGYALFAATDLNQSLEAMLSRTQGQTATPLRGNSRQVSFQMAHARYQSLQQEWNLLLSNRQLWMEQPVLTPWVEEVNRLGEDLEALAAEPSARRARDAKLRLEKVRSALNERVLVQTTNSSYRLQTWRHRLTAIEQLLAHGEGVR
ncbi:MAG: family 10 glycosylhydrolase [Cyanobacteria bacterium Co-bin13]|nr:family 10 glycosylhydrolase [Cyanobacteria bacterium Co-bin13]